MCYIGTIYHRYSNVFLPLHSGSLPAIINFFDTFSLNVFSLVKIYL